MNNCWQNYTQYIHISVEQRTRTRMCRFWPKGTLYGFIMNIICFKFKIS